MIVNKLRNKTRQRKRIFQSLLRYNFGQKAEIIRCSFDFEFIILLEKTFISERWPATTPRLIRLSKSVSTRSGENMTQTAMAIWTRMRLSNSCATLFPTCPMVQASMMKTSTSASVNSTKIIRVPSRRVRWSSSSSRSLVCDQQFDY